MFSRNAVTEHAKKLQEKTNGVAHKTAGNRKATVEMEYVTPILVKHKKVVQQTVVCLNHTAETGHAMETKHAKLAQWTVANVLQCAATEYANKKNNTLAHKTALNAETENVIIPTKTKLAALMTALE
jgi:hypothetical protein